MTETPDSVIRTRVRRLALALARVSVAILVLHHGWLLFERLRNASISDPAVAVRWGLAALVLGLAVLFQRRGLTVLSGRSGLVFWLLVLLLHIGLTPIPIVGARPENLLVALPLGLAATLALALGAARWTGRIRLATRIRLSTRTDLGAPPPRRTSELFALCFAPRPPPAA